MPVLKNLEPIYQAACAPADLFRAKLSPVPNTYEKYQHICCAYFVKAYRTYQAIYDLVSNGYEPEALVLARANFEVMVQMAYLLEGGENSKPGESVGRRAQRVLLYNQLERYRHYDETRRWKKVFGRKASKLFNIFIRRHRKTNDWKQVVNAYSRWRAKNGKKRPHNYWTEQSIKGFCEWMSQRKKEDLRYQDAFIGQKWAEFYLDLYKEQSIYAHSIGLGFEYYLEERPNGRIYYKFEPTVNLKRGEWTFKDATVVLGVIMYYLAFALKEKRNGEVRDALKHLGDVLNERV